MTTNLTPDEEQLIALLDIVKATGNTKARRQLQWSTPRYEIVKASLIARGMVAQGGGRGGSLRLLGMEPNGR